MRRLAEFTAFFSIAVGAHALAFVFQMPEGAPQAAGNQGTELLSLTASSEAVAMLIEEWETPPDVTVPEPTIAAPVAPPAPSLPETSLPEIPQVQTPGIALPQMTEPPATPDLPKVEKTAPPPPEAEPAITEALRPITRPKPPAPKPPAPKQASKPDPKPQPERKTASVSSRASNAAKAAGQGGGTAAGQAKTSEQAGLSKSKKTSLMREWGAAIHSRIARNVPRGAGRGAATVRVTIGADGRLQGAALANSSGSQKIDRLALLAVERAGRFPPAPKGLGVGSQSFRLEVQSR